MRGSGRRLGGLAAWAVIALSSCASPGSVADVPVASPTDMEASLERVDAKCVDDPLDEFALDRYGSGVPTTGFVCRVDTTFVGAFEYDDADALTRAAAEVEVGTCPVVATNLAWTVGAGWLIWATDDVAQRGVATLESVSHALELDAQPRTCHGENDGPVAETPELRSEEEIYEASIVEHEFGEPIVMPDGILATVRNPRVVRRDIGDESWVWVVVDLRLENTSSVPVGNLPSVDMVCAGSNETGGYSLTSPYDPYETLPAGATIDTVVEMLPPGHGVVGVAPPTCASPASVRLENLTVFETGEPHDVPIPESVVDEVNQ